MGTGTKSGVSLGSADKSHRIGYSCTTAWALELKCSPKAWGWFLSQLLLPYCCFPSIENAVCVVCQNQSSQTISVRARGRSCLCNQGTSYFLPEVSRSQILLERYKTWKANGCGSQPQCQSATKQRSHVPNIAQWQFSVQFPFACLHGAQFVLDTDLQHCILSAFKPVCGKHIGMLTVILHSVPVNVP